MNFEGESKFCFFSNLAGLFVIGTSNGKAFTPSTEMNPVQVLQEEISYMISLLSSNKILMASKSCGNMVLVNRNQDNLFVDQCLSKHFDSIDGLKVSSDETLIVAWSSSSSDVCIWSKNNAWSKTVCHLKFLTFHHVFEPIYISVQN